MPLETTPISAVLLSAGWKRKMGAWISPRTRKAHTEASALYCEQAHQKVERLIADFVEA